MDPGTFQGILTAIALLAFLGMAVYVYAPRHANRYDRLARLPLDEEEQP